MVVLVAEKFLGALPVQLLQHPVQYLQAAVAVDRVAVVVIRG